MRFSVHVRGAISLLALLSGHVHAGRPMVTDDAGLVDHMACQVETWVQRNRANTEFWAAPGCNFTGNLELTLGGGRIKDDDQTLALLQGKPLFKPLETNGWGIGLVFGTQIEPRHSLNGDLYAFVPVSFSFHDDRVLVHTNLGWLREKERSRHRLTRAVGSELQLDAQMWLSIEAFGQNQGCPFYQIGARHWLVPERVQLDAT